MHFNIKDSYPRFSLIIHHGFLPNTQTPLNSSDNTQIPKYQI